MATTTELSLLLPAVPASVREARVAVAHAARELDVAERVVDDMRLCVSEAVSNVVRHAYGSRAGELELVVESEDDTIHVLVRDSGFGPSRSRDEPGVGGYGMMIVEKLADRFSVTPGNGAVGTEVRMVFSRAAGP